MLLRRLAVAPILLTACLVALAEEDETVHVTCGSAIKLEHQQTQHLLNSQEVAYGYGRSSGQQSVTGLPDRDSASCLWIVRSAEGDCPQGTPVKHNQEVKLQHMATRRWLHSHLFHSPLSNNQEVSCFGDDETTDTGDVWIVEIEDSSKQWARDAVVRLKHKDTGAYLASHNVKYQRPIPGHTEVFASTQRASKSNSWRATEGVYFPPHKEL